MRDSDAQGLPIKCVQSDLPEPSAYVAHIERAHSLNWFTNFGTLCGELSVALLENFGLEGEACVPCNSATAGLSAALIASGCAGPVLVPGFTFPATYGAVLAANLRPLVMDVSEANWAIAPDALVAAIERTNAKGVILVSPFGLRIDFAEHLEVCRRCGVVAVIDSAAGLGVQRINRCTDPSVFEVFSLHATKPLGVGEGGAVYCSISMATALRRALNFGLPFGDPDSDSAHSWGFNGKISELHAAVGLAQMQRYRPMIEGRQRFAALYQTKLADFPVTFPRVQADSTPWQVFPVLADTERSLEVISAELEKVGIEIRRYYRPSLSCWPGAKLVGGCPVSESLAARMFALPVRSMDSADDGMAIVVRVQKAFARALGRVPRSGVGRLP